MSAMFHVKDGLFLGRKSDGSVRILRLLPGTFTCPPCPDTEDGPEVLGASLVSDSTLSADEWAESIATLSLTEQRPAKSLALAIHDNVHPLPEDAIDRINNPPGP